MMCEWSKEEFESREQAKEKWFGVRVHGDCVINVMSALNRQRDESK
jgi:hypothetical protein